MNSNKKYSGKSIKKVEKNKQTCSERCTKFICCESQPLFPDPYNFSFTCYGTTLEKKKNFQTNFVRTSKYTPLSFLPKALALQFKRLPNVYFLIVAILQSIPVISPLNPIIAWVPLVFVLTISMIRQGYQDFQRIKTDREMNYKKKTKVVRKGKIQEITWSEVVVGDTLFIEDSQVFPADLILLTSSNKGDAYIETASLDGQKNLKIRNSFKELQEYNSLDKISNLSGNFYGQIPDQELHRFSAKINFDQLSQEVIIEGDKQLLYRGTFLKNTKWIFGLVILTGRNTKIMMNAKSSKQKMSQIQKSINSLLLLILLIQFVLCFCCAIIYSFFKRQYQLDLKYINWNQAKLPLDSFFIFLSYFVLLNTMIPISLIVSIEVVKFAQKVFIEKDKLLHSDLRNQGVRVKSASLNEELGQIEYIFTDKTGTLTMNIMEFKIAVIGYDMYGDRSIIYKNQARMQGNNKGFQDRQLQSLVTGEMQDQDLGYTLAIADENNNNQISITTKYQLIHQYLQALSITHEVIADVDKKGNKIFQGPSPDEITLVDAAKNMNYEFILANDKETVIKILGKQKKIELLETFAFTSDRKRMSVIIRQKDGPIKMYMKGADSIVEERLSPKNKLNLQSQLTKFSTIGLRTLLIAMKTISDEEYETFKNNVSKLPPINKEQELNDLISKLQTNMYVIGATAVLDRLQDEVPETLRDLIRANIKIWMLTGDKMETAENIAKSCFLIQEHFQILRYKSDPSFSSEDVLRELKKITDKTLELRRQNKPKALLIQGSDLTDILSSSNSKKQLANLAKHCESVVCCRLLPSQKAQIVKLVRKYLNKITLSIGDGANDIPMIKQAHIGIGLHGEEGAGAVQACDYALPEFRMLWRMLLVHGRWNYIRISEMILYFFYKNMLFTLPQFYLAFYVGFSAQTAFDDGFVVLFNLAFTSLPLVFRAIVEQDINYIYKRKEKQLADEPTPTLTTLIKQQKYLPAQYKTNKNLYRLFPKIYFVGQENCIFNMQNYLMWMLQAVIQSIVITYFSLYIISEVSVNATGINSDYWLVSSTIYSSVIIVVTFKLITHTRYWSWALFLIILFSAFGLYCLQMWVTNFTFTEYIKGTTLVAWTSPECYLVVLLCTFLVLFIDGIIVFLDFTKGGNASKMRILMRQNNLQKKEQYDRLQLMITEKLTRTEDRVSAHRNNR